MIAREREVFRLTNAGDAADESQMRKLRHPLTDEAAIWIVLDRLGHPVHHLEIRAASDPNDAPQFCPIIGKGTRM